MDNHNWAPHSFGGGPEPVLLEGGGRNYALTPGGAQGQDHADGLSRHQTTRDVREGHQM